MLALAALLLCAAAQEPVPLLEDTPVQATVGFQERTYFSFVLHEAADPSTRAREFTLSVAPRSGGAECDSVFLYTIYDCGLCASDLPDVGTGRSWGGSDSALPISFEVTQISLLRTECGCQVYNPPATNETWTALVYQATDAVCEFDITLSLADTSFLELVPGAPPTALSLAPDEHVLWRFDYPAPSFDDVAISLTNPGTTPDCSYSSLRHYIIYDCLACSYIVPQPNTYLFEYQAGAPWTEAISIEAYRRNRCGCDVDEIHQESWYGHTINVDDSTCAFDLSLTFTPVEITPLTADGTGVNRTSEYPERDVFSLEIPASNAAYEVSDLFVEVIAPGGCSSFGIYATYSCGDSCHVPLPSYSLSRYWGFRESSFFDGYGASTVRSTDVRDSCGCNGPASPYRAETWYFLVYTASSAYPTCDFQIRARTIPVTATTIAADVVVPLVLEPRERRYMRFDLPLAAIGTTEIVFEGIKTSTLSSECSGADIVGNYVCDATSCPNPFPTASTFNGLSDLYMPWNARYEFEDPRDQCGCGPGAAQETWFVQLEAGPYRCELDLRVFLIDVVFHAPGTDIPITVSPYIQNTVVFPPSLFASWTDVVLSATAVGGDCDPTPELVVTYECNEGCPKVLPRLDTREWGGVDYSVPLDLTVRSTERRSTCGCQIDNDDVETWYASVLVYGNHVGECQMLLTAEAPPVVVTPLALDVPSGYVTTSTRDDWIYHSLTVPGGGDPYTIVFTVDALGTCASFYTYVTYNCGGCYNPLPARGGRSFLTTSKSVGSSPLQFDIPLGPAFDRSQCGCVPGSFEEDIDWYVLTSADSDVGEQCQFSTTISQIPLVVNPVESGVPQVVSVSEASSHYFSWSLPNSDGDLRRLLIRIEEADPDADQVCSSVRAYVTYGCGACDLMELLPDRLGSRSWAGSISINYDLHIAAAKPRTHCGCTAGEIPQDEEWMLALQTTGDNDFCDVAVSVEILPTEVEAIVANEPAVTGTLLPQERHYFYVVQPEPGPVDRIFTLESDCTEVELITSYDCGDCPIPLADTQNKQYGGTSASGSPRIVEADISKRRNDYCGCTADAPYESEIWYITAFSDITVRDNFRTCQYTLTAETTPIQFTPVSEGTPVTGSVGADVVGSDRDYYEFVYPAPASTTAWYDLEFVINPVLGTCTSILYSILYTCGECERAVPHRYNGWARDSSATLPLEWSFDLDYRRTRCGCDAESVDLAPELWRIAIDRASPGATPCEYTLDIVLHEVPVVAVTPGVPSLNSIADDERFYFSLDLSGAFTAEDPFAAFEVALAQSGADSCNTNALYVTYDCGGCRHPVPTTSGSTTGYYGGRITGNYPYEFAVTPSAPRDRCGCQSVFDPTRTERWYFLVEDRRSCDFSITTFVDPQRYTDLEWDVGLPGLLEPDNENYYRVPPLPYDFFDVLFEVEKSSGSCGALELYATYVCDSDVCVNPLPSSPDQLWGGSDTGGINLELEFLVSDMRTECGCKPIPSRNETWFLTVRHRDNNNGPCTFSVTARALDVPIIGPVEPNALYSDSLDKTSFWDPSDLYRFDVPLGSAAFLSFDVTAAGGSCAGTRMYLTYTCVPENIGVNGALCANPFPSDTQRFGGSAQSFPITVSVTPEFQRDECGCDQPGATIETWFMNIFRSSAGLCLYTLEVKAATLEGFFPGHGPVGGGTLVSIRGARFVDASSIIVQFEIEATGETRTAPGTYLDQSTLVTTLPAFSQPGAARVTIDFDGSIYSNTETLFVVYPEPTFATIGRNYVPVGVSSPVVIRGTGFIDTGSVTVRFQSALLPDGGVYTAAALSVSETTIEVEAPALSSQPDDLIVEVALNGFDYVPAAGDLQVFVVVFAGPLSGPVSGGTRIVVDFDRLPADAPDFAPTLVLAFPGSDDVPLVATPVSTGPSQVVFETPESLLDQEAVVSIGIFADGALFELAIIDRFLYYVEPAIFRFVPGGVILGVEDLVRVVGCGFSDTGASMSCELDGNLLAARYISPTEIECVFPSTWNTGAGFYALEASQNGQQATREGLMLQVFGPPEQTGVQTASGRLDWVADAVTNIDDIEIFAEDGAGNRVLNADSVVRRVDVQVVFVNDGSAVVTRVVEMRNGTAVIDGLVFERPRAGAYDVNLVVEDLTGTSLRIFIREGDPRILRIPRIAGAVVAPGELAVVQVATLATTQVPSVRIEVADYAFNRLNLETTVIVEANATNVIIGNAAVIDGVAVLEDLALVRPDQATVLFTFKSPPLDPTYLLVRVVAGPAAMLVASTARALETPTTSVVALDPIQIGLVDAVGNAVGVDPGRRNVTVSVEGLLLIGNTVFEMDGTEAQLSGLEVRNPPRGSYTLSFFSNGLEASTLPLVILEGVPEGLGISVPATLSNEGVRSEPITELGDVVVSAIDAGGNPSASFGQAVSLPINLNATLLPSATSAASGLVEIVGDPTMVMDSSGVLVFPGLQLVAAPAGLYQLTAEVLGGLGPFADLRGSSVIEILNGSPVRLVLVTTNADGTVRLPPSVNVESPLEDGTWPLDPAPMLQMVDHMGIAVRDFEGSFEAVFVGDTIPLRTLTRTVASENGAVTFDGDFGISLVAIRGEVYRLEISPVEGSPLELEAFSLELLVPSCPGSFEPDEDGGCVCAAGFSNTQINESPLSPGADCEPCQKGFYKAETGDGICVECPPLYTTPGPGTVSPDDCLCAAGLYLSGEGTCEACPDGTVCLGDGEGIAAEQGWWLPAELQESGASPEVDGELYFAVECFNEDACCGLASETDCPREESDPSCRRGYQGPLCSLCAENYGKARQTCTLCDEAAVSTLLVALVIMFILAVICMQIWLVYEANVKRAEAGVDAEQKNSFIAVRILLSHMQFSAMAAGFAFQWPAEMTGMFSVLDSTSQMSTEFSFFDCSFGGISTYDEFVVYLLVPVFGILLPTVVLGVVALVAMLRKGSLSADTRHKLVDLWCISVLVALFFVYPTVTKKVLQILNCYEMPDGELLLIADMAINCRSSGYTPYEALAIVALLVFCLGMPIATLGTLFWYRERLFEEKIAGRLSFLYAGYRVRENRWFWEAIVTLRKLALITVSVLWKHSDLQLLGGIWIVDLSLMAHLSARPYQRRAHDRLEMLSLFANFCAFNLAPLYDSLGSSGTALLTTFLVLSQVVVFVHFVVLVSRDGHEYVTEKADEWRSNVRRWVKLGGGSGRGKGKELEEEMSAL